MNFNVYVEDTLGKELEAIAHATGKSRNALIREAIQLWLSQHKKSQWSKAILEFKGVEDSVSFEDYRDELLPPSKTDIF